jgi:hypothetical protein
MNRIVLHVCPQNITIVLHIERRKLKTVEPSKACTKLVLYIWDNNLKFTRCTPWTFRKQYLCSKRIFSHKFHLCAPYYSHNKHSFSVHAELTDYSYSQDSVCFLLSINLVSECY